HTVALVGYTNAGKSTLFNRLAKADVFADSLLFATLDPTLRGLTLTDGTRIILSDTVGFISDLPTDLVAAFRATLEEVLDADLILLVVDAADPQMKEQREAVRGVLADLGVDVDADSRIMRRSGGGFDYAYNGQTAVDEQARIIIAAELVNTSADVQQMPAVLQVIHKTMSQDPQQVLADAGYRSEQVMAQLAKDRPSTDLVIALGREGKALALKCDADKYPHTAAMAAKLQTEQGQRDYRKRKWIAEPPNAWIKAVLGFRQFSMRTLKKCQAEFKLVCMAVNLRRMSKMIAV
ncbi:MAG: transposase, partial [Brachymonas sp.]|nr:transposase [Brachymonas sp.]